MNKKLYHKVIDYINEEITSGNLTIGDLIPSENQLSKLLGVSVGTVRKAIDKLENSNLLYRHHGKGTYVSDYGFDNSMFNFFSYGSETGSSIRIYKTTPIRKKTTPTSEVAFQLEIERGADVIYLERRGYIDKKIRLSLKSLGGLQKLLKASRNLIFIYLTYSTLLSQKNLKLKSQHQKKY